MSGVRVYHPTARSTTLVLHHKGGIEGTGRRQRVRGSKDYHIRLDSTGHGIVSPDVWKRVEQAQTMLAMPLGRRLVMVDVVRTPPKQGVGFAGVDDSTYTRMRGDGRTDDMTKTVRDLRRKGRSLVRVGVDTIGTRPDPEVKPPPRKRPTKKSAARRTR